MRQVPAATMAEIQACRGGVGGWQTHIGMKSRRKGKLLGGGSSPAVALL